MQYTAMHYPVVQYVVQSSSLGYCASVLAVCHPALSPGIACLRYDAIRALLHVTICHTARLASPMQVVLLSRLQTTLALINKRVCHATDILNTTVYKGTCGRAAAI